MIEQNQIIFVNKVNFNKITFPIIFLDFEAYHLLKNSYKVDYFPQTNAKPFLLGYIIVKNHNDLINIINTSNIPYYNFFYWKVNNKQGNSWKKFANFLNKIVEQNNLKSLFVMGKLLEQSIFEQLYNLNFLNEKFKKLEMYDIYDFYISKINGQQIDFLKIKEVLNFYGINNYNLNNKKNWNIIWRKLDQIYSFSPKKKLKEFQKHYLSQIKDKNYYDLVKLIILFYKKYIS